MNVRREFAYLPGSGVDPLVAWTAVGDIRLVELCAVPATTGASSPCAVIDSLRFFFLRFFLSRLEAAFECRVAASLPPSTRFFFGRESFWAGASESARFLPDDEGTGWVMTRWSWAEVRL